MSLLRKYVWLERGIVLLGNVAVNLGIMTTTQESAIAAGGVIAVVTVLQVVTGFLTHYKTVVNALDKVTVLSPASEATAAAAAGKALTNG